MAKSIGWHVDITTQRDLLQICFLTTRRGTHPGTKMLTGRTPNTVSAIGLEISLSIKSEEEMEIKVLVAALELWRKLETGSTCSDWTTTIYAKSSADNRVPKTKASKFHREYKLTSRTFGPMEQGKPQMDTKESFSSPIMENSYVQIETTWLRIEMKLESGRNSYQLLSEETRFLLKLITVNISVLRKMGVWMQIDRL